MMKISFNARSLHNWISIALVIPMFIVAFTSLFMAHEKVLALKQIRWGEQTPDLKTVLYDQQGLRMLASKEDVYERVGGRFQAIPALHGVEVRLLRMLMDSSILAAGKNGLWLRQPGEDWQQKNPGDIHGFQILPDGRWIIIEKEAGILSSADQGRHWQTDSELAALLKTLPPTHSYNLEKLMHDLHIGKALFGEHQEWVWIDILALVLGFLCLSGAYLWWKAQIRRQQ